jgi:hypothetical protein
MRVIMYPILEVGFFDDICFHLTNALKLELPQ